MATGTKSKPFPDLRWSFFYKLLPATKANSESFLRWNFYGDVSGVFFTPFTYMPLYHYNGNLIGHFKFPHGLFSSEYFRKIELTIFLREAGIDRDSSPSSLLTRYNNHPF